MLKASHQQHFTLESLAEFRIVGDVLVHDLDDDLASEVDLFGEIDASHAAFAEEFDSLVTSKKSSAGHGIIHWCAVRGNLNKNRSRNEHVRIKLEQILREQTDS